MNMQTANDILGRTYLDGPWALAFWVVCIVAAVWMITKPKNKFGMKVVHTLDALLFGVVAVVLFVVWMMGMI
jgi:hypothetical protein